MCFGAIALVRLKQQDLAFRGMVRGPGLSVAQFHAETDSLIWNTSVPSRYAVALPREFQFCHFAAFASLGGACRRANPRKGPTLQGNQCITYDIAFKGRIVCANQLGLAVLVVALLMPTAVWAGLQTCESAAAQLEQNTAMQQAISGYFAVSGRATSLQAAQLRDCVLGSRRMQASSARLTVHSVSRSIHGTKLSCNRLAPAQTLSSARAGAKQRCFGSRTPQPFRTLL